MLRIALLERRFVISKPINRRPCYKSFSSNHKQPNPKLDQKKSFSLWHNPIEILLVASINQNIVFKIILYVFNQQFSGINFSVFNEGIHWSLDFGPDFVILTKKRSGP